MIVNERKICTRLQKCRIVFSSAWVQVCYATTSVCVNIRTDSRSVTAACLNLASSELVLSCLDLHSNATHAVTCHNPTINNNSSHDNPETKPRIYDVHYRIAHHAYVHPTSPIITLYIRIPVSRSLPTSHHTLLFPPVLQLINPAIYQIHLSAPFFSRQHWTKS